MTGAPDCIWQLGAELGEGPAWHGGALWLVDIKRHAIHRCGADGADRRSWQAPGEIGFALPAADGSLVCGLPGRLMRFDPHTGAFTALPALAGALADEPAGNRLNDGHIDARGRLWFGSMDNGELAASGALYLLDPRAGGALQRKDQGYVITNGPAFSPDGRTFYHTDTMEKTVYAFDAGADGTLSGKRVFATIAGAGWPDGTAVDADGHVWIALFGGARAQRHAPDGTLVGQVDFPCSNVTKIAFGGPDLRTAFATTARKGLTPEQLAREPLAGGVFSFSVATPGQAQHAFLTESAP